MIEHRLVTDRQTRTQGHSQYPRQQSVARVKMTVQECSCVLRDDSRSSSSSRSPIVAYFLLVESLEELDDVGGGADVDEQQL